MNKSRLKCGMKHSCIRQPPVCRAFYATPHVAGGGTSGTHVTQGSYAHSQKEEGVTKLLVTQGLDNNEIRYR